MFTLKYVSDNVDLVTVQSLGSFAISIWQQPKFILNVICFKISSIFHNLLAKKIEVKVFEPQFHVKLYKSAILVASEIAMILILKYSR